ncbi:DUF2851 family protein [Carboxylicivirga mesophila]|uniref:DUF2851 family protein n=1 Tax=Carboxylicivirga mesophila TaxID=1166478 RepID=A0ABS5KDD8_9BACT|nr:DUF2851 family protein [Carboxylicivirga mesophila]MBS2212929.1 DUF2851 family protein [Carboxylicivirga mesophila]
MNEDLLHYIWQYKLYKPDLRTTDNKPIEVIHPGIKNTDGGPDFFNAKIKIDGTLWAGNVEIHQNEKEWYLHQHHQDPSYDNVILHVVEVKNETTYNSKMRLIPACCLPVSETLKDRLKKLYTSSNWIACAQNISNINEFTLSQWMERMLIERLEEKSHLVNNLLKVTNNNWDQVFFILLARSFGFGINGLSFELMAKQTPLTILLKHTDNLYQMEALLFGQAGLLHEPEEQDEYTLSLKKEYEFLRNKYLLKPISQSLWKFLRLRPANFPTIRIAQLAYLMCNIKGSFEQLLNLSQQPLLLNKMNIGTSDYWKSHYVLGKQSSKSSVKLLGSSSKQRLIVNTIIPYLFIYAAKHKDEQQKEKIIDYLYQQPAEKNKTLEQWNNLGVPSKNEAQAQALLYLKSNYCNQKKCLNCHIGHEVLCKN